MSSDPPLYALAVEVSWLGRVMQSDLMVPGRKARSYVVGEGRSASFALDRGALGGLDSHELIRGDGTIDVPGCAYEARLLRKGDIQASPVDLPAALRLRSGERVSVRLSDVVFEIRSVKIPARLRLPTGFDWNAFFIGLGGVPVAILAIVFVLEYMERSHHHPLARLETLTRLLFPDDAPSPGPTPEQWVRSSTPENRPLEPCASSPRAEPAFALTGGGYLTGAPGPSDLVISGAAPGEVASYLYDPIVLMGYGMCIQRDDPR